MSIDSKENKTYTLSEAVRVSGLTESTLRYYEKIGLIHPITRNESSKQRMYYDEDLELISTIACLNATGMSINAMRAYLKQRTGGAFSASSQIALLRQQLQILDDEAKRTNARKQYVSLKIAYWEGIVSGKSEQEVSHLTDQAQALANDLRSAP